ncbi:hypothetical protein [Streptomyces sp. NPDC005799]|uniref:hypothetical protein n=1 Tax=Streptomyces sp. NPDC005799 TaxID=3154678 RepID=UPI0033C691C5
MQSVNRHGTTPTQPQTDDTDTQNAVGKGADANAYLALAAYVAAMAHGIEERLTARPACDGDAYQDQATGPLFTDLSEALTYFDNSTIAQLLVGKDVVRHYAQASRAELAWHRRHVTDMERQRGIR